jgi:hypothetical protein
MIGYFLLIQSLFLGLIQPEPTLTQTVDWLNTYSSKIVSENIEQGKQNINNNVVRMRFTKTHIKVEYTRRNFERTYEFTDIWEGESKYFSLMLPSETKRSKTIIFSSSNCNHERHMRLPEKKNHTLGVNESSIFSINLNENYDEVDVMRLSRALERYQNLIKAGKVQESLFD